MAKKKFAKQRRIARMVNKTTYIYVRERIDELVSFVAELGLEARVHPSDDDNDDYYGFEIWPDTWDSFTWIEIPNPSTGNDLELALYGGIQIVTKTAFRNYPPFSRFYKQLFDDLAGYVRGSNVMVRVTVGDQCVTQGIVATSSLKTTDWAGFIERLIAEDFNWSAWAWSDNNARRKSCLKALSKEVSLKGCRVLVEYWGEKEIREISISPGVRFDSCVNSVAVV